MKIEVFIAWGIDSCSDEGHGLIGRYWWFNNHFSEIPSHMEGCKFAMFKTRKLAREAIISVKGEQGDGKFHSFPDAKVVKLIVTVGIFNA